MRPEVVVIIEGRRWMAQSRSVAGAWWDVTYDLRPYLSVDGTRTRWEMRCPCPHGEAQLRLPIDERRPCAHMRAVVADTDRRHRRPAAPVNASTFVD